MMKRGIRWWVAALLLGLATPAWARVWQVDSARSTLTFTASCGAVECSGRFRRFDARIAYDPTDVRFSKFDMTVDVASLVMQDRDRARTALGATFLDAAEFPQARFTSVNFLEGPDGGVTAEGELVLRGVIKPVVLHVEFAPHADTATLDVTARLNPREFGIDSANGSGASPAGETVNVYAHLLLRFR